MNLTPQEEENRLNKVGDTLAALLKMKREPALDSQGRIRWITDWGTKTGVGLIRSLENFLGEEK